MDGNSVYNIHVCFFKDDYTTRVQISQAMTGLLAQHDRTVLFNHVLTYCMQLGESTGVVCIRTCKTRFLRQEISNFQEYHKMGRGSC